MSKRLIDIKPLSKGQEEVINTFNNKDIDIIGIFGPTGTGKSLLSIAYGINAILNEEYKRFLIFKPLINVVEGKELSIDVGKETYLSIIEEYFKDIILNYIDREEIKKLLESNRIQFVDLHYLKGRTFDNSIIFIDDIQNVNPESILEVIIRVGNNSRLIVAGDPVFQRLKSPVKEEKSEKDAAALIREVLLTEEKAKVIDLGIKDIIRYGAKKGLKLLLEVNLRKRKMTEFEEKVKSTALLHAPDGDIITVVDITDLKQKMGIKMESVPDIFILTKTLGRIIGKGGERITKMEKDLGKRIRAIELNLELKDWILAFHPLPWIHKHIIEADFAGPQVKIKVNKENIGAFIGQKGIYIRFLEEIFLKVLGVGVIVEEVEVKKEKTKK